MKARREFSEAFKAGVEYAKDGLRKTDDGDDMWPDADEIKAAADKAFYAHRGIRELTREEMLEHLRGLGCVNPRITEDTPNRVVITYDGGPDEGRIYGFCIRTKIAGVDIAQVKLDSSGERIAEHKPIKAMIDIPPLVFALGFVASDGSRARSATQEDNVLTVVSTETFGTELGTALAGMAQVVVKRD